MAGTALSIDVLRPAVRNQGIQIPNLLPCARWIDAVVLTANAAKLYTFPVDANGRTGTVFSITATAGPLFFNFRATASITGTDVLTGASSGLIHTDSGADLLLAIPPGAVSVSFICGSNATVYLQVFA